MAVLLSPCAAGRPGRAATRGGGGGWPPLARGRAQRTARRQGRGGGRSQRPSLPRPLAPSPAAAAGSGLGRWEWAPGDAVCASGPGLRAGRRKWRAGELRVGRRAPCGMGRYDFSAGGVLENQPGRVARV